MPAERVLAATVTVVVFLVALPVEAASKEYAVDNFERVYVRGDAMVHLDQGGDIRTARAEGSDERLADLVVESSDGVLYIDAGSHPLDEGLVIHVPVAELKEIVNQGRGTVTGSDLRSSALALEGHGSGSFELAGLRVDDLVVIGVGATRFALSGAARHQAVELSGQGSYDASGLSTETSQVDVRGTGLVDLWVDELLDINLSGDARIRYTGTPWVQQQVFGAGVIDQLP